MARRRVERHRAWRLGARRERRGVQRRVLRTAAGPPRAAAAGHARAGGAGGRAPRERQDRDRRQDDVGRRRAGAARARLSGMSQDLAEVYRTTYRALVRFLYRKVWDAARAEDLAQEAFARAVVHKPDDARGWLFIV